MTDEETSLIDEKKKLEKSSSCASVNTYILPAKIAYLFRLTMEDTRHWELLFFMSIGLSLEEASFVNGIQYVGGLFIAPIIGFVVNKTRAYGTVAISCFIMAIILNLLYPAISIYYGDKSKNICPYYPKKSNNMQDDSFGKNRLNLLHALTVTSILSNAFEISAFSLIDSGVLQRMASAKSDNSGQKISFGRQKVMGAFGMCLGTVSNSLSVRYFPHSQLSCYSGIYLTYLIYGTCLAITSYYLFKGVKIENIETSSEPIENLLISTLKSYDTLFFLICVSFNGIIQAIWYSFTYRYMKELHAPTMLYAVSMTTAATSSFVMNRYANHIIDLLGGPMRTISICWFFMGVRCVTTGLMWNPYFLLFPELIAGASYSVFLVATIEYIKERSDPSIITTMCALMNSLYNPFSYLLANLLGGRVYSAVGGRQLFCYCALVCLIWSVITLFYVTRSGRYHAPISKPSKKQIDPVTEHVLD